MADLSTLSDEELASLYQQAKGSSPPQGRGVADQLLGLSGPRYQTWPERLVRGAISGAVSGATLPGEVYQDAQRQPPPQISDSDVAPLSAGRVVDLAAIAMPINPAVRAGDRAIPGVAKSYQDPRSARVPTATQLDEAADEGYKALRESGVEYRPEFIQQMGLAIERKLQERFPDNAAAFGVVKKLQEAPAARPGEKVTAPLERLEFARQQLNEILRGSNNGVDRNSARLAKDFFDQALEAAPDEAIVAGAAAPAREALQRTRANYAAAQRSNKVTGELDRAYTGMLDRAELQADTANSGKNFDNSLRQNVKTFLRNKKNVQGFTDQELDALRGVAKGAKSANAARKISNFLGGGGGLGAAYWSTPAALGTLATGNPYPALMALAPVAGAGIKGVENALSRRAIRLADELIRKRSPLYKENLAAAGGREGASPASKAALIRALLEAEQQQ